MPTITSLPVLPDTNTTEPDLDYDAWLAQKVQVSRAGLANGSNQRFTPDEWAAIRAAKKAARAAA